MARPARDLAPPPPPPPVPGPARRPEPVLRRADRRSALIDAAAALVARDGIDAVSMETVAVEAGVSRALVYKHFGNRHDLLAEVYRREATLLDQEIVDAVDAASGLAAKVGALVQAVLRAEEERGPVFASLHDAGVRDDGLRREQRARNRRTVSFFTDLAVEELGVSPSSARAGTAVLLTGLDSVRAQWRAEPTIAQRQFLETLYVELWLGALSRLPKADAHGER